MSGGGFGLSLYTDRVPLFIAPTWNTETNYKIYISTYSKHTCSRVWCPTAEAFVASHTRLLFNIYERQLLYRWN